MEASRHSYELLVRSYAQNTILTDFSIEIPIITSKSLRNLDFGHRLPIFGVKSYTIVLQSMPKELRNPNTFSQMQRPTLHLSPLTPYSVLFCKFEFPPIPPCPSSNENSNLIPLLPPFLPFQTWAPESPASHWWRSRCFA